MRQPDFRTPVIGADSVSHEARLLSLWETSPGLKGSRHRRSQANRHSLHRHRLHLPGDRRPRGLGHAHAARRPNLSLLTPEQYNQLFSTHA